jgi:hypothetical protein
VLALLALSGCSSGRPAADPPPSPTDGRAAESPSSASASSPSGAPSPGSTQEPATTSGRLSQRSFPTPAQLGTGWRYAVDPGNSEEGYGGNGTPALERNPDEIVQTAVPFGCDRTAPMPAPTHALEVDYTMHGAKAIAVRGSFAGTNEAARFFAARAANLRACSGRSGSQAIGPLVARLASPARDALTSDRTPESDPWRELAVLDRDSVVLLAVQGTVALNGPQARRLVTAFR